MNGMVHQTKCGIVCHNIGAIGRIKKVKRRGATIWGQYSRTWTWVPYGIDFRNLSAANFAMRAMKMIRLATEISLDEILPQLDPTLKH